VYSTLADVVLIVHLSWIVSVAIGFLWTRGRRVLTAIHLASLVWGIAVEAGPWPCPLTLLEQFLEKKAGVDPYRGGFLLHYLDAIVYPDVPASLLMALGIGVCAANLAVYARRLTSALSGRRR
jgi:hypothetical protein